MRRSVVAEQSLKGLTDVKWGVGGGRKAPGAPAVCTYLLTTVRTGRSMGGRLTLRDLHDRRDDGRSGGREGGGGRKPIGTKN